MTQSPPPTGGQRPVSPLDKIQTWLDHWRLIRDQHRAALTAARALPENTETVDQIMLLALHRPEAPHLAQPLRCPRCTADQGRNVPAPCPVWSRIVRQFTHTAPEKPWSDR